MTLNHRLLTQQLTRRSMMFARDAAQATVLGTMNSLVVIRRGTSASYDEENRVYIPAVNEIVYDDTDYPGVGAKAGVTPAQGPVAMQLGDEPQYFSNIQVYIPEDAPKLPRVDDVVEITYNPETEIVGRLFRVMDVVVGGRISASISMSCMGVAPSRQWEHS